MHLMYTLDAQGNRLYTLKKVAQGQVTKSAHPARFSPDDKWSRQRVTLKRRFELLLTQQSRSSRSDLFWMRANLYRGINLRDQNYRTTEKDSTDGVTVSGHGRLDKCSKSTFLPSVSSWNLRYVLLPRESFHRRQTDVLLEYQGDNLDP